MFKTRLISGIVLVLIALLTIGTGGWVLFGTLLIISLIGAFELYRAMHVHEGKLNSLEIISYLGIVLYYLSITMQESRYHTCAMILCLILILFIYVFSYPKYHANQIMAAFFGIIYVAVMLSYIYQIRRLPDGKFMVWLVFLCSWGCDTCAYCVGVLFGKHKMAPVLSPKKSIEGAVGGVVGAALLGFIFQWITVGMSYEYAVICAIGGLISMIGDLAASAIKRNMDIKDYGKLIPGHGGILDRFDSVIITAPIIYYLAVFLF
ncbi:MAG: phosphatidate cytidylyltransferase [Lachnospiraceae bacterium]|nr:phosphatidate cytidylyltransferase [Lachnospiraceae bacterium]